MKLTRAQREMFDRVAGGYVTMHSLRRGERRVVDALIDAGLVRLGRRRYEPTDRAIREFLMCD